MADSHEERLRRARVSLEGLSVGDAFGVLHGIRRAPLRSPVWRWTDDSLMAFSIYHILRDYGEINQDALAQSFALRYVNSEKRGYGPGMRRLLPVVQTGGDWRKLAHDLFAGQGSFGNGSAMRVAPLGAYFADDLTRAVEQSRLSAEVTHAHSEGAAGAIAVAIAAAVACNLSDQELPSRAAFIEAILPHIPASEVREGIARARGLVNGMTMRDAVAVLGNGSQVTCQDTVPFVLWCAGEALDNYEDALWLTASAGGDRDTTCAMVGGIVACYTGIEAIPLKWQQFREPLPEWAVGSV
jgi:ADP-ribosylglycohydrolase